MNADNRTIENAFNHLQRIDVPTKLGNITCFTPPRAVASFKKPMVFLHGIFLTCQMWRDVDLPRDASPVLIDMPGHGQSDAVSSRWSLEDCVDVLDDVIRTLSIKRPALVGHSWGGMVSLRYALRYPDRVESLGLINTPFRRVTGTSRLGFHAQKMLVQFQRFYGSQAAKSLFTSEFLDAHPDAVAELQTHLLSKPISNWRRALDAVLLGADEMTETFERLRCPAKALIGKQDYVGRPPGIETTVIPGGHVVPMESPIETARWLQSIWSAN